MAPPKKIGPTRLSQFAVQRHGASFLPVPECYSTLCVVFSFGFAVEFLIVGGRQKGAIMGSAFSLLYDCLIS